MRRAVIADAEIEHFNLSACKRGAVGELAFEQMPEGLLKRDLQGFRKRVTNDGDAVSVRRLLQSMFAVAQARAVDAHISRALFAKPAGGVGPEHPTRLVFKGVEVWI